MESRALETLLADLDHSLESINGMIRIKPVSPNGGKIFAGYSAAFGLGILGLGVFLFVWGKVGFLMLVGALFLAANTWRRKDNSSVRTARSILIKENEIAFSHGFQTHTIQKGELIDISLKHRSEGGQHQVQLFFKDDNNVLYESLIFFGPFKEKLIDKVNRVADYLWAALKNEG